MTSLREVDLDPRRIRPVHTPKPGPKVAELTASMKATGWGMHRRLLVEQLPDGSYQAWTGSNRIMAARAAQLPAVPVLLVDVVALEAAKHTRHESWRTFNAVFEYDDDDEDARTPNERKYEALREAGDIASAELMRQEIESPRAEPRGREQ